MTRWNRERATLCNPVVSIVRVRWLPSVLDTSQPYEQLTHYNQTAIFSIHHRLSTAQQCSSHRERSYVGERRRVAVRCVKPRVGEVQQSKGQEKHPGHERLRVPAGRHLFPGPETAFPETMDDCDEEQHAGVCAAVPQPQWARVGGSRHRCAGVFFFISPR